MTGAGSRVLGNRNVKQICISASGEMVDVRELTPHHGLEKHMKPLNCSKLQSVLYNGEFEKVGSGNVEAVHSLKTAVQPTQANISMSS